MFKEVKELKTLKLKLVVSFIAILLALALIAGATAAWYVLSTNPEISGLTVIMHVGDTLLVSADGIDYSDTIDISSLISDYTVLKPVSTSDLRTFFIPQYNDDGSLKQPNEFVADTDLSYANQATVPDTTGMNAEQAEKTLLFYESQNYYVYCDVWLKCQEEEGCTVRMSVPHYSSIETAEDELDNKFGTYVLPKYEIYEDIDGNTVMDGEDAMVGPVSNYAETAFRIGFLVYGNSSNPDVPTGYMIYEPNADTRSSYTYKNKYVGDTDDYVYGYDLSSSYEEGAYIETKPLGYVTHIYYDRYVREEGVDDPEHLYVKVSGEYIELTDANSSTYPESSYTRYVKNVVDEIEPVTMQNSHLIIQKKSEWNLDTIKAKIRENETIDSMCLSSLGRFLSPQTVYSNMSSGVVDSSDLEDLTDYTASNNVILSLSYNVPVRVRLFFWIEGQDVDCWNDTSSGAFLVNIELAGKTN